MAEEIVIKCKDCGRKLVMSAKDIGKKGRCPNCGSVIRVQRSDDRVDGSEKQVVAVDEIETRKDALLRIQKQNDVAIVSFVTSRILDQSNVQQLGEEMDALVDDYHLGKIVLNFDGVTYMSSAVMGKLVGLLKKCQAAKAELKLCTIEDSIYEIFEIMRFDKMFDIHKTQDDAVLALIG
jgi:anti-sigma B factor antagonist